MNPSTTSSSSPPPTPRNAGYLLACDPGLRCVGVALFRDGVLVRAGAVRGPVKGRGPAVWSALAREVADWTAYQVRVLRAATGPHPTEVDNTPRTLIVETMRVDPYSRASVPEDLLEVQAVAACIVGRLADWTPDEAPAHKWKGQVKRDVMGRRVEQHLRGITAQRDAWSAVEVPSVKDHLNDVMHAVGIGWWYLDGGRA